MEVFSIRGFASASVVSLMISLNRVVDFASVYRHFARSFHAQAYLITANLYNDNPDVIVDDDTFILLSG
jgi:hypothetical protein